MFEYSIAFAEAKIGTIVRLNVKTYVSRYASLSNSFIELDPSFRLVSMGVL